MRLKDNPFWILGVDIADDIDTIDEKTNDKLFFCENNTDIYDNARTILTHPNRRIAAEVRWFYNTHIVFSENIERKLDECMMLSKRERLLINLDRLGKIDTEYFDDIDADYCERVTYVASIFENIDECYASILDWEEVVDLLDDINRARKKAKIPVIEENTLRENISTLKDDIVQAIGYFISNNDYKDVANVVNSTISNKIEYGKGNCSYSEVIEVLINLYSNEIKAILEEYGKSINSLIKEARLYTHEKELEELCNRVRVFDFYAQPIQLYLQDIGSANKQMESNKIAFSLRDLLIYYHNERGMTELAKIINELIIEVFPELPQILMIAKSDQKQLNDLIVEKDIFSKIQTVRDEINKEIIREQGYSEVNQKNIVNNCCRWLQLLNIAAGKIENSSMASSSMYAGLALTYATLASACTWGDCWQWALDYCLMGKKYAIAAGNNEIINDFNEDEKRYRNNLLIEAQEEAEKRRILAEKQKMYYSSSWGIIFIDRVNINPEEIIYNGKVMNFTDVKHIIWGGQNKIVDGVRFENRYITLYSNDSYDDKHALYIHIQNNDKEYEAILSRVWQAVGTRLYYENLLKLKNNQVISYPGVNIYDTYLTITDYSIWSSKEVRYAWKDIEIRNGNGTLCICDRDSRVLAELDYLTNCDLHIVETILRDAKKKGLYRLSSVE